MLIRIHEAYDGFEEANVRQLLLRDHVRVKQEADICHAVRIVVVVDNRDSVCVPALVAGLVRKLFKVFDTKQRYALDLFPGRLFFLVSSERMRIPNELIDLGIGKGCLI